MSSPEAMTCNQVSPVADPFSPGAAPIAADETGSNPSQTPIDGMAFELVGEPFAPSAWVTTVNIRPARTGKLNQSVCPTWLSRPVQNPLAGRLRGSAGVPIASSSPPGAESLTITATVWVLPAIRAGITTIGIVPDGATWPNPYGPTELARI